MHSELERPEATCAPSSALISLILVVSLCLNFIFFLNSRRLLLKSIHSRTIAAPMITKITKRKTHHESYLYKTLLIVVTLIDARIMVEMMKYIIWYNIQCTNIWATDFFNQMFFHNSRFSLSFSATASLRSPSDVSLHMIWKFVYLPMIERCSCIVSHSQGLPQNLFQWEWSGNIQSYSYELLQ